MVSLEFNPEKYINAENVKYTNYVDINKLNERHEEVLVKEKQEEPNPELMLAHGKNLITNPEHALFQGYLQEYYCYYCPCPACFRFCFRCFCFRCFCLRFCCPFSAQVCCRPVYMHCFFCMAIISSSS